MMEAEIEKRRDAWNRAVSNSFLSGIIPSNKLNEYAEKFINGENDIETTFKLMVESSE